jgi:septum formation protein
MSPKSPNPQIILASTSPYRKNLLQGLGLDFATLPPNMDETPGTGESPRHLTRRLAEGKARGIAALHPTALVIGCDQVAEFEGSIVGKPGNVELAVAQLLRFSGKSVKFLSALCVLRLEPFFFEEITVPTLVSFRDFDDAEARRYVELDMPLDCAGSFRSEAAGSVLLTSLESTDPTALVGLPLIALSRILRQAGVAAP